MKIKGLLFASAAVVIPVGAAVATDLPARMPTKAPVMVAPAAFSWTGFYLGGNVGIVWSRSSVEELDAGAGVPTNAFTHSGAIAGLQAGYNWQISSLVLGLEADYDWSSASRSVSFTALDTHNAKLSSLGTVRARAGIAFDRWLAYVTGGVAFASLRNQLVDTGFGFVASRGTSATGWTAGGGLEYAFDPHWSAKAEYLYAKFQDKTVTVPGGYVFRFKDSESIARAGINYHF